MYKEDQTQYYDPGRTATYYTIFPITSFSINRNKTRKSRLKHKIKYDLYNIAQEN